MSVPIVKIEKEFNVPAAVLFQAIGEGVLFKMSGPKEEKMEIDFKVGGKYRLEWPAGDCSGYADGEFTEIVENELVKFTWNGESKFGEFQNSEVTVRLKSLGNKTSQLILEHSNLRTEDLRRDHEEGWESTIADLKKSLER